MNSPIRDHLARFWPDRTQRELVWTAGPIRTNLPGFRAIEVKPNQASDPWIYATDGARSVPTPDGVPLEFFIESPSNDPIQVENLAMVANFHADPRHRLQLGQVIRIGRPWMGDSTCDHLLVSLPYPFGPTFEWFDLGAARARLLWLLPITASEAAFATSHGHEALEQLLETERPDVLQLRRPSAV